MLRQIVDIAALHLRMTLRRRLVLVFWFALPLLFTFVLGLAMGGGRAAGPGRWVVRITDDDASPLSERLVSRLAADPSLDVRTGDRNAGREAVAAGDATVALVISAGFGGALRSGTAVSVELSTNPGAPQARLAAATVAAAVRELEGSVAVARGAARAAAPEARDSAFDTALSTAEERWATSPPVRVDIEREAAAGRRTIPRGFQQTSPGILVMFSMVVLLSGAAVLIQERQRGTLARLLVMPVERSTLLAGKCLGICCSGLAQMTVLIVAGQLLFDVGWGSSPGALALVLVCYSLAITGLGIMMAAWARTFSQARNLANLVVLVAAPLGGAWWPLEVVPAWMRTLGHALPTAWAMDGFHDIVTRGLGVAAVAPEAAVLLGFFGLFMAVGVRQFRYE